MESRLRIQVKHVSLFFPVFHFPFLFRWKPAMEFECGLVVRQMQSFNRC